MSLSAVSEYRKCEAAYNYSYVAGIRKRTADPAPTLGRLLHDYLATYYNNKRNGLRDHSEAHGVSLAWTLNRYTPEIESYHAIAASVDDKKTADRFERMPEQATELCNRYYVVHGRNDWDRYDILQVERKLRVALTDDIDSVGVIDLVARDTTTGNVSIWEHKSSEDPPKPYSRLRDLQTLLYKTMVLLADELHIDSVVWNNIRTKPPTVPELLQRGGLTKRKDLDTTWHVYLQAIRQYGLNPNDYRDMYERLNERERTVYFMRHEQEVVTDPQIVLGDYITDAREMQQKVGQWRNGAARPVRNLSRSCDYCTYNQLCMAAITGGNEDELIALNFTRRGRAEEEQQPAAQSATN